MIKDSFMNSKQGLIISQEKEQLIEKIIRYYRKTWASYEKTTLVEQVKDLEIKVPGAAKLSAEELVEHLINSDIIDLKKKDLLSLQKELRTQEQEG